MFRYHVSVALLRPAASRPALALPREDHRKRVKRSRHSTTHRLRNPPQLAGALVNSLIVSSTMGHAVFDGRGCVQWFLRQQGERILSELTVDFYVIIR